jgi:hypothetical protein
MLFDLMLYSLARGQKEKVEGHCELGGGADV